MVECMTHDQEEVGSNLIISLSLSRSSVPQQVPLEGAALLIFP